MSTPNPPTVNGRPAAATLDQILSRLDSVKTGTGGNYTACCPAHADQRASLSIGQGDDGKILLHCHAGCDTESIVQALGLEMCQMFPNHQRNGQPTISTIYDYVGEDSNLLYQVVRFLPKDFRQRRPDGHGGWIWKMTGVRRVLYRLPELVEAVASNRIVWVVEGEKDADALADLGLCSTTNSGGAGKWQPDYGDCLRSARVAIIPDNDAPGHKHAEQVAKALFGVAKSIRIVKLPSGKDVSEWLEDHDGTKAKLLSLAKATPKWEPTSAPKPKVEVAPDEALKQRTSDGRPTIMISVEEHRVNADAVQALARDTSVYQRGGLLVHIVRDNSPATKGIRRPFTPRIEALPPPLLRERLTANAVWVQMTSKGLKEDHPPGWCVSAVHAHAQWQGIRYLEAIVDYPVLRPDGTILSTPGYDDDTGLLLVPKGQISDVPEQPTHDDAIAARDALLEVVADFPFKSKVHKAAWLAGLLTPLARFAFNGPAPLFLVDANVRAAGKGLLLDCIARIVTGERFTVATYTQDQDELRKRITSLAMGGDRLVLFDNLEGKFGNAVLDAALTATSWRDRVLGVSRMMEAPLYMTWYATGNNVIPGGDTARRICHIRLESNLERPEEREDFRHRDLLGYVAANRAKLLSAALIILRAYCVAGQPDLGLPAWGSFGGWSDLVRAAVVWVDLPDPGKTRLLLQQHADVEAESLTLLLECWAKMDPERRGLTVAEVLHRLYKDKDATERPEWYSDMRSAIETLVGRPDARALGNKLRSFLRRIFNGHFLDKVGTKHQAAKWSVFPAEAFRLRGRNTPRTPHTPPVEGDREESDESGESPSPQAKTGFFARYQRRKQREQAKRIRGARPEGRSK